MLAIVYESYVALFRPYIVLNSLTVQVNRIKTVKIVVLIIRLPGLLLEYFAPAPALPPYTDLLPHPRSRTWGTLDIYHVLCSLYCFMFSVNCVLCTVNCEL